MISMIGIIETCSATQLYHHSDGSDFDPWLGLSHLQLPIHYSPFWGGSMLSSNYLRNLRFFGNIKTSVKFRHYGSNVFVDRRYDIGGDKVTELLIKLFPSNTSDSTATLEAHWNSSDNLGNFILNKLQQDKDGALGQMASLLVKAEIFRLSLSGKNPFVPGLLDLLKSAPAHQFLQKLNTFPKSYKAADDVRQNLKFLLNSKMGMSGINTLLVDSLKHELLYRYPIFTIEHALLAFNCSMLQSVEDVQMFLMKWDAMRNFTFHEDYLHTEQNIFDTNSVISLARTMSIDLNEMTSGIPYVNPVGSGFTRKWVMSPDDNTVVQTSEQFSDCVESSIRHTMNYIIWSSGTSSFDKEVIRGRVLSSYPSVEQRRRGDRLDYLEEFYRATFNRNDGSLMTRAQWNKVTFGLNSENDMLSPYPIVYKRGLDIPNSGNELVSNLVNVVGVIGGILGIKSDIVMNGVGNLPSLLNRLRDLFTIINPNNQYALNFERCDPTQSLKSERLQTFVRIAVTSRENSFNFLLNNYTGHGSVTLDYHPPQLRSYGAVAGGIRNFADYLFPDFPEQNPYSSIFSFAGSNSLDYKLLRAVRVFSGCTDQFLKSAINQSIVNIAGKMPFADEGRAMDIFKKLVFMCKFNDETYKAVRELIPDPRHLQLNLKQVALHVTLSESDQFDMTEDNGYIEELSLSGAINDVVKYDRLSPSLKIIHLSTLWNLDRLNFRRFTNLRKLSITCNNYSNLMLPTVLPPVEVTITRLR
ncbi:MAG: hypothetical protein LBL32_01740 [Holosporales bacterium]|nr:hypothetical protein [Holosporales bacterium]